MRFMSYKELAEQAFGLHHQASDLIRLKRGGWEVPMNEARRRYVDLVNNNPDDAQVMFMLGTSFLQTGESSLGWMILRRVAELRPDFMDVWNNLGACYRQEHHNDKARECYLKALELKPNEADVLANICALHVNEGTPQDGIEYGERCLAAQPNHPQGLWNLGLLYLEDERYEEGFTLYNRGFETGDRIIREYVDSRGTKAVLWNGESDTQDKTLVLHCEQGQGDALLFAQFIPFILERFARVIIDCHPKLYGAMTRAFPKCTVYPTRKVAPTWAKTEQFDYYQSTASLPQWFHTKRKKNAGWLTGDPAKNQIVKGMVKEAQRFKGESGRPVIGIHWMGGKQKTRVDLRSVPLEMWKPIFDLPVTILSHQYTESAPYDVGPFADRVIHWQALSGEKNKDLDWNIALMEASDLLISVNTTAIHIAGSMDKPCWALTPYGRAWRYGKYVEGTSENPFYRSVTQYNQSKEQPWPEVMQTVATDLRDWITDRTIKGVGLSA